jgi:hypothetical protein
MYALLPDDLIRAREPLGNDKPPGTMNVADPVAGVTEVVDFALNVLVQLAGSFPSGIELPIILPE